MKIEIHFDMDGNLIPYGEYADDRFTRIFDELRKYKKDEDAICLLQAFSSVNNKVEDIQPINTHSFFILNIREAYRRQLFEPFAKYYENKLAFELRKN